MNIQDLQSVTDKQMTFNNELISVAVFVLPGSIGLYYRVHCYLTADHDLSHPFINERSFSTNSPHLVVEGINEFNAYAFELLTEVV